MTNNSINSLAASIMSITAAVFAIYLGPWIESASPSIKAIAVIISSVGMFGIFRGFQSFLSRRRYKDLLGTWYYSTVPYATSSFKDANFAVMDFFIGEDGYLAYKVETYPSRAGLETPGSERSRGQAVSRACRYNDVKKSVDIVFAYTTSAGTSGGSRDGRLSLRIVHAGHIEGDWTSEVRFHQDGSEARREISTGWMVAARPKEFFKIIDAKEAVSQPLK